MKKIITILLAVLFGVGAINVEAKPKLIGMKRAQEIASARAKGLRIKAKELEKEHGKWIYSFEFKNRDGSIREVNVNAYSGKVIAVEHESAKKEAAEEKNEKKEKH